VTSPSDIFPAARIEAESGSRGGADPAPPAVADGAALNILVVEDNIDSQVMVCELVGMLGHRVRGVDDGEQALDAMRAEDFDVLFTDVSLPGMSGIALARLALRDKPGMRVIFSTGYGKEALERLDFPARILRKPYDLQELKAALDQRA